MKGRNKLLKLREPRLIFGHGQMAEDPRDGLSLFGPFDRQTLNDFSVGIIGTKVGISVCHRWLSRISKPVFHPTPDIANPFFPGFEETFEIKMNSSTAATIQLDESILEIIYRYSDNHVRVSELVNAYLEPLQEYLNTSEKIPDVWLVVIPDQVYTVGRPNSSVPKKGSITVGIKDQYTRVSEGMFETDEIRKWREAYRYENNFHNQLKIRLLKHKILTQIVKEGTIGFREQPNLTDWKLQGLLGQETAKAWNLATALYYKLGGLPWKLADIRPGVCYIGLTFKQDLTNKSPEYACCAAQMFLDSGDGMVFRGRVGPYYNPETEEYHLTESQAKQILEKAIASYEYENGEAPKEIFVHGKTYFDDSEWSGFESAAGSKTKVVGVRIRAEKTFKLYRKGDYPVMRGTVSIQGNKMAYLWTKGFIPRIQSILGLETPNPMQVQVIRGEADIRTVCEDVMSLTKLNYNSCKFCDGQPVTLKFSDLIGEILTAGPNDDLEVLPFKYYI